MSLALDLICTMRPNFRSKSLSGNYWILYVLQDKVTQNSEIQSFFFYDYMYYMLCTIQIQHISHFINNNTIHWSISLGKNFYNDDVYKPFLYKPKC